MKKKTIYLCAVLWLTRWAAVCSQTLPDPAGDPAQAIDLVNVLRLAKARNIDIQIARERLAEAKADEQASLLQFFPWVSPGLAYRRHEHLLQDAPGNIIEADKQSFAAGPTVSGQLDLGETIYRRLAARQLATGAGHAVAARQNEVILLAVQAYFDLARAQADQGAALEAIRIATNYLAQVRQAVEIGVAQKADALRVQVQAEKDRATLSQTQGRRRAAAARLAQVLNLDPAVNLAATEAELAPLPLMETNLALGDLVGRALAARPELKESQAALAAARKTKDAAVYGPMIPTIGAQVFAGALGGGLEGGPDRWGQSEDYQIGLSWRIGPGGLFDKSRQRKAEARLRVAELNSEKLLKEITAQVVEAQSRALSLSEQIVSARRGLEAAEETLKLSQARKEFAVGIVLEVIQAEQELTRARMDYIATVADFNKAQYGLAWAVGR